MTAKEFWEQGYLQEVNRRFLHPLGLALSVVLEADGSSYFGELVDNRDDLEGMILEHYSESKRRFIDEEEARRERPRKAALGFWIEEG